MTAFVRLGPADFAEMARRVSSPLTGDGAQAWYRHDVAELLQEITCLRQEYEDAIARFMEDCHGLAPEPMSLPELADFWKAHATQIYEKAQVKKLREQVRDAQADADQAKFALQSAHDHSATLLSEREQERRAAMSREKDQSLRILDLEEKFNKGTERIADLGREVLSLREQVKELEESASKSVLAATLESDAWKADIRDGLQSILEKVS